ncbi:uncharacterized protein EAF02_009185 [Botrytis sinoallii]|uniref:uncharacterized protein n=1 Tax=Botrytis sinoallii TaxID=1463999 RepID=UPI0019002DE2|nr:uncharacterized protein EAF02_009185 [Botrytis sinoallii]KAF7872080.1 hypothetical protein EAF02_009185 [Botrytis sinoallii]
MSSSHHPQDDDRINEDENEMFDPADAAEEIIDIDGDAAMDSGDEDQDADADADQEMQEQEIQLQNDSSAHMDAHGDSIFCIAQHPLRPELIATGGSDGDADNAPGVGYIFDATPAPTPVLPASYQSNPSERVERGSQEPIFKLEGHTDSINALAFSQPDGKFLVSGGLDGKVQVYVTNGSKWKKYTEAREVEEVNWLLACPYAKAPNTFAFGANDGSVWVYTVDPSQKKAPLQLMQSYFAHTESCTAGAWSADGKLLATVSEDGSLYVWDVFGEAAAAGLTGEGGQTVVGLTALDQRFAVEGGLFSVGIAPSGSFVAAGGAGGSIKIVGLPRLPDASGAGASPGQSGQILADLQAQGDGIESIAFAQPPLTLMAAASVDGSIALFDSAHRFAVRRHIKEAHEEHAVVKVEFVKNTQSGGWLLTSCGMDGVVRRWDARGGTGMANSGLVGEWKGHRGDGVGVMGFVQGDGNRIVTAGDDGISLVFESPI